MRLKFLGIMVTLLIAFVASHAFAKGGMIITDKNNEIKIAEIPDNESCPTRYMGFSFELPIVEGGGFHPQIIGVSTIVGMERIVDGEALDKWTLQLRNHATKRFMAISKPSKPFGMRSDPKNLPEWMPECSLIGGRTGMGTQNLTIGGVPVDNVFSIKFFDTIDEAKAVMAERDAIRAESEKRAAIERAESERRAAIERAESERRAAENQKNFAKEIKAFRSKLQEGQETHCGMVIEVKQQLIKVQTMVGERWFRRDQLFRGFDNKSCRFVNGVYSE